MIAQIYISHSTEDENLAEEISQALWSVGIDSYVEMYRHSESFSKSERISFGIRYSDCFIALLTMEGLVSPTVNQEIGFARGLDKLIFPLIERGADLPCLISHLKPISFSRETFQDALGQVIRNLRDLTRLQWLRIKCPFCGEEMTQYLTSQEEVDRALFNGSYLETVCSYCENALSLDPRTFRPIQ